MSFIEVKNVTKKFQFCLIKLSKKLFFCKQKTTKQINCLLKNENSYVIIIFGRDNSNEKI